MSNSFQPHGLHQPPLSFTISQSLLKLNGPYMWDSKRDTNTKNRLLDSVGEGEGGMIWETSIEKCLLPYVK